MPEFDWRSAESYRAIQDVNATGLAWEFLRRNPEYRREALRLIANPADGADAFAERWGLSFPGGPAFIRNRGARILARGPSARHPLGRRRA